MIEFLKKIILRNDVPVILKEEALDILVNEITKKVNIGGKMVDMFVAIKMKNEIKNNPSGGKIRAIKMIKDTLGSGVCGLKDAKEAVEEWMKNDCPILE
jgi:ribosomal protein L7/L12